jgi:tRNA-specific 2-thiouridylase
VQVRAHGEPVAAEVEVEGDRVVATLDAAIRGVAPGQALVVYDGTRVVGSATITGTADVAAATAAGAR